MEDKDIRNHRFLEEAVELVQANHCTEEEAHRIVSYVFSRKSGFIPQEAGGVMVTLAALLACLDVDMDVAAEVEFMRAWNNADKIREKDAHKPRFK